MNYYLFVANFLKANGWGISPKMLANDHGKGEFNCPKQI